MVVRTFCATRCTQTDWAHRFYTSTRCSRTLAAHGAAQQRVWLTIFLPGDTLIRSGGAHTIDQYGVSYPDTRTARARNTPTRIHHAILRSTRSCTVIRGAGGGGSSIEEDQGGAEQPILAKC